MNLSIRTMPTPHGGPRPRRFSLLALGAALLLMTALSLAACSGGGSGGGSDDDCLETLCAPGETACRADGHFAVTCEDGGKAWAIHACATGTYCTGGECVPTSCAPGARVCAGASEYKTCDPLGSGFGPNTACDADLTCVFGECLKASCFAGEGGCGSASLISCSTSGAGWEQTPCGDEEHCEQAEGKAPTCVTNMCKPFSRQCDGAASWRGCDAQGVIAAASVACDGGESCLSGLCVPIVCEPADDADVAITDVIEDVEVDLHSLWDISETDDADTALADVEIPPLDPPDSGKLMLDGERFEFEMNLSAKYVANEEILSIAMNELVGTLQYQLEILVRPIPEYSVGEWSSDDPSEVGVDIRLNDGTGEAGAGPDSWKYQSASYAVEINEFGPVGGRVKGSFSAILKDATGGPDLTLTNGSFNIKRKN
jgi:hypothetical protein